MAKSALGAKLSTILDYYLKDAESHIELIAEAMRQNNLDGVIQPAHTLKSSSRQFGAIDLADLAEKMETAARMKADNAADIANIVPSLRSALIRHGRYRIARACCPG
jgi:HPt (histidine-containing phosphotransfer) domain-containing protein